MKLPDISSLGADKAFSLPAVQKQWTLYMSMFGPVLEKAYSGNSAARIHLINLLNKLGRRETEAAEKLLSTLDRSFGPGGEAEDTLRHFLLGLIADARGQPDDMIREYEIVLERLPGYYLPRQKIAMARMQQFHYAEAAEHLDQVISMRYTQRPNEMALGGLYANLAMCQLMLHHPDEARKNLEHARRISAYPAEPVWAMLLAVQGDHDGAQALCQQGRGALLLPQVQQILEGKHPHFFRLEPEAAAIAALHAWLEEHAQSLDTLADQAASAALSRQLAQFFPALAQYPACAAFHTEESIRSVTLRDFHGLTPQAVLNVVQDILPWPANRIS